MLINCDIGERGIHHLVDLELMEYIGMANIACGGHTGDKESVDFFLDLCLKNDIIPTAHLSYPDKKNFGRIPMDISFDELKMSLDKQYKLLPWVKSVKFHGALYNDVNKNRDLADSLGTWLLNHSIRNIVTQFDSELAFAAKSRGINVIAEAFAERRYAYNNETKKLSLVPRGLDYASINNIDDATEHSCKIIYKKKVDGYFTKNGTVRSKDFPITADTICVHSDSEIALELVKRLMDL